MKISVEKAFLCARRMQWKEEEIEVINLSQCLPFIMTRGMRRKSWSFLISVFALCADVFGGAELFFRQCRAIKYLIKKRP